MFTSVAPPRTPGLAAAPGRAAAGGAHRVDRSPRGCPSGRMCAASISLLRFRKPRGVASSGSIRPILDERIGWPILLFRPILRNPSPGQRIRRGCERKYGPPHRTNLRAASAAVASRLRPGAPRSGAGVSHNGTKKAGEPGSGDWLVGDGEMGKLVRSMDWAKTPLG